MELEPVTININNIDYYIYESNNQLYCKSSQTQDIIINYNKKERLVRFSIRNY